MAASAIAVTVVLDFMCPWSYIGLKSLDVAMARWKQRQQQAAAPGSQFRIEFVPFEFDPPGTYPPEGTDWTEYCRGYGPAKARFLLEQKLPAAFALGHKLGIEFKLERRIVGTEAVNAALLAAQEKSRGMAFALRMLREHFELLHDPNEPQLLAAAMSELGVPADAAMQPGPARAARNVALTQRGRAMSGGSVPHFVVKCDGDPGGGDVAAATPGGPTSPEFFEQVFAECEKRADAARGAAQAGLGGEL
ncbi:thioredoxin-like protein [Baffinella frigidus]|nr:thioredoxin-like protein [Cryptophyta sp. CCMP2293]|mmetsp:Transcript_12413/g.30058  ORF Transcript_12413/g.30058 Transcript_12413/m.30058 type:complete len:249 (+) Transcript_12413:102-848(+)